MVQFRPQFGIKIGCQNGNGDNEYGNSGKPYWAIHCVNAYRKEQDYSSDLSQIFQKILEDIDIEGGKSGRYWIKWDEWNENEKHGEENCRDIYDKIENDVYPKTINDMAVSMSIEEVKKEIE